MNAVYHEYIFFAGRRIARSDVSSGSVYYLFADHLGSTRAMTQDNGSVCFTSEYYPYGQELNFTSTCSTNYKFTGYERDAETGIDYAFARYYNPRIGRFMSGDPLGGGVSDPQTLNRYSYVRGNPVNLTDPSGLLPPIDSFGWMDWYNPPDRSGRPKRFGDSALSWALAPSAYFNGGNQFCDSFAGTVTCPRNNGEVSWLTTTQIGTGSGNSGGGRTNDLINDPNCIAALDRNGGNTLRSLKTVPITVGYIAPMDGMIPAAATSFSFFSGKPSITINSAGPFFSSNRFDQQGILLHELGHVTGALRPDHIRGDVAATRRAQDANRLFLEQNCSSTL